MVDGLIFEDGRRLTLEDIVLTQEQAFKFAAALYFSSPAVATMCCFQTGLLEEPLNSTFEMIFGCEE